MLPFREYKYHRAWAFLLIIYGQLNCPDSSCRQRAKRPVIGSTPKSLLLTVQMYKKAFNHARTLLIILRFITHFIVVVYIQTIFLCQIPFTIKLFNRQKGSTPFLKCSPLSCQSMNQLYLSSPCNAALMPRAISVALSERSKNESM